MSDYIVEMNNITKKFPGIIANDNISIQIRKGEIYAILGENGAGKTTLMSMLFGMYEPDQGEIIVKGQKVEIKSANEAAALNIGMVHQHFKLIPNYTITENIILGVEPMARALGFIPYVDIKKADEEILQLSRKYGLEVEPTRKIEEVTVSVQQRVEILKMLYREAEILIFDEPTAVLTPQEIDFLLEIMEELRKSGKTIILITHKLEEIKRIADRCAILREGKLITVLDVESSTTHDMAYHMVGREVSFTIEKNPRQEREPVLSLESLSVVNRDQFQVVKNVSFTIHGGEIFAIAGVSGNGQLEIADAIAGLMKASAGTIKLNGKDITHMSIRERTREGMSYIPEDRQKVGLILDFPLWENLSIKNYDQEPYSVRGILNDEEMERYAERLIKEYDVRSGQGADSIVRSMSGGNQQKAIIAREIELDSSLMIFVQPTRGLDIGAIENIRQQILRERDKGRAVLLISMELDEIMALADTIGVIYNGEILKISEASSMTKNEVGKYMMGVKA